MEKQKQEIKEKLFSLNNNLKKMPENILEILIDSIQGDRMISLDFAETQEILKANEVVYDYIDYYPDSDKIFNGLINEKYVDRSVLIVFVLKEKDIDMEKIEDYEKSLKNLLKPENLYSYGIVPKDIEKSKILIMGTRS